MLAGVVWPIFKYIFKIIMYSMYCLLLIWQLMQRHMLAGTFFSIGLNDQDVRFSLLGNKQTDELEFSVSTGNFIHEAERT